MELKCIGQNHPNYCLAHFAELNLARPHETGGGDAEIKMCRIAISSSLITGHIASTKAWTRYQTWRTRHHPRIRRAGGEAGERLRLVSYKIAVYEELATMEKEAE